MCLCVCRLYVVGLLETRESHRVQYPNFSSFFINLCLLGEVAYLKGYWGSLLPSSLLLDGQGRGSRSGIIMSDTFR